MGGQEGSRGYLYQGIISIFNACAENNWHEISVEYTTPNDKVDVALMAENSSVLRAIQVKSSINLFSKDDIICWLISLLNDISSEEYQLILIGNCQESANTFIKSVDKYYANKMDKEATASIKGFEKYLKDKSINIILMPFDKDHLMGVIRDSLNHFISLKGYNIDYSNLEEIAYALLSLHMFLGTKGKTVSKVDYENKIIEWLNNTANGSMKKAGNHSTLEIMMYDRHSEKLSDKYVSESFNNTAAFTNYKNKLLREGKEFIDQISAINLPAFERTEERKSVDPEYLKKYIKGDIPKVNFGDFLMPKKSELDEKGIKEMSQSIKEYWNIDVDPGFYNVGNLTESSTFTSITGSIDYNGTKIEKRKNSLISKLKWQILILDSMKYLAEIMCKVQLLPFCIVNTGTIPDRNISVSISSNGHGFHLFNIQSDINDDNKELLDVLADIIIEEKILDNILCVKASTNIDIEPKVGYTATPFVMPDPFSRRRRYDFSDLVNEFSDYQIEENPSGTITYEFSALRPGEAKWLSPYMMIIIEDEEVHMGYTILSEASGSKKSGVIAING